VLLVTRQEAKCKKIGDRLIGFKFTMDDRHMTAKEDGEQVSRLLAEFENVQKSFSELELQVWFTFGLGSAGIVVESYCTLPTYSCGFGRLACGLQL